MLIYSIGILLDCEEKKRTYRNEETTTLSEEKHDKRERQECRMFFTEFTEATRTTALSWPSIRLYLYTQYTWPDWSLCFAPSSAAGFKLATGNRLIDWWGGGGVNRKID